MVKLIGLFGKKQVGKDTSAKIIQELIIQDKGIPMNAPLDVLSGWSVNRFALPLKQTLSLLTGIPVEDMEKEEVKNKRLGEEWRVWKLNIIYWYRTETVIYATREEAETAKKDFVSTTGEVLHDLTVRTELPTVREALEYIGTGLFRHGFHPNTWLNAAFANAEDFMVFADGRFKNEDQAIKDKDGITIKILRDTDYPTSMSEEEIDDIETDYIIYNDESIPTLKLLLRDILQDNGIIKA